MLVRFLDASQHFSSVEIITPQNARNNMHHRNPLFYLGIMELIIMGVLASTCYPTLLHYVDKTGASMQFF